MLQYKLPKKFDEKLKKRFANICKFFNHINKFILLLRKGIPKDYPYEYMDSREKFITSEKRFLQSPKHRRYY